MQIFLGFKKNYYDESIYFNPSYFIITKNYMLDFNRKSFPPTYLNPNIVIFTIYYSEFTS